jgi:hypothetical protein
MVIALNTWWKEQLNKDSIMKKKVGRLDGRCLTQNSIFSFLEDWDVSKSMEKWNGVYLNRISARYWVQADIFRPHLHLSSLRPVPTAI